MAQSPSYFVNSPASGTQYWAPRWCGCIDSGEQVTVTVKAWSGANGTGSLVQVSTLQAIVWDDSTGSQIGSFSGNFNTTNAAATGANGHIIKCSGKWTGAQSVGSLEMYITYSASSAYVPAVSSISPTSGGQGTSVTITGTRFTDATFVNFNGVGASFSINSDTQITATAPAGCGNGAITVGNPAGSGNSGQSFNSVPAISNFTPSSGGQGTSVTINGSNFNSASAVKFNTVAATSFTVVNDGQITATVPAGAGLGTITVTTASGTATSGTNFNSVPSISSISPTLGPPGSSVTITGTNFNGATAVKLNGVNMTSYTVNSDTQITATIPTGATAGPITVTTASGTATSSQTFQPGGVFGKSTAQSPVTSTVQQVYGRSIAGAPVTVLGVYRGPGPSGGSPVRIW